MSLEVLAAEAVKALSPYLPFIAKGAATEIGKGAIATAKSVYEWARKKLGAKSQGALILDRLVVDPTSEEDKALLKIELSNLLTKNPGLVNELGFLVEHAIKADSGFNQSLTGNNSKVAQIIGTYNHTLIS